MTPPRSMSPTRMTGTRTAVGKPHIGDVVGAEIDLGGAACAFDEHKVGFARELREAAQHARQEFALHPVILRRRRCSRDPAFEDELRVLLGLGLQQHRIHRGARRDAAGARLQRLGAADLAAIRRHRGVVRHVLRLERPHREAAPREGAAEPRDDHDLPTSEPVPWIMSARSRIRTRCRAAP